LFYEPPRNAALRPYPGPKSDFSKKNFGLPARRALAGGAEKKEKKKKYKG